MHSLAERHQQIDGDSVVNLRHILRVRFHDGFTGVHFDALFLKHVDER